MNQAGIDLLKDYEGFRAHAYLDMVGVPTIGYGFTKGVQLGDVMTVAEADARLLSELEEEYTMFFRNGTENQLSAMQCLAWNIGIDAFRGSTVCKKHAAEDYDAAADAFRMWCKAGGKVVPGLVRRREAERALYLS